MTTWTKMKIENMIECSTNATKTHVTITTPYGSYTESVKELKQKVDDPNVLPHVRKMFQIMLDSVNEQS